MVPPTKAERLAYLSASLEGFSELISRLVQTILEMRGEENPDQAVKALRAEFLNLKAVSPDGMRFVDDSDRVLATCEDFLERVTDLVETRSASRKSGRVLSQGNYERLSKHHSSMKELWEELGQLLELHTPVGGASGTGEGEENKSFEDELSELELKFYEFEMEAELSAEDSEPDGADAAL
jgi:superfamily I DNA and RNA helicase